MCSAIPVTQHHLSIDKIEHNMDCPANKLNAGEYEFLTLIREFAERGGWIRSASRNCAQWLEWRFDLSASARRAQNQRGYRSWPDDKRGMVTITVELATEEAALFEKAVEKAVREFGDSNNGQSAEPDDNTSWGAIQADAVVNMAKQYLSLVSPAASATAESSDLSGADSAESAGPKQSSSSADHYQVMIHIDEAALAGRGGCSDLPVETIRRLYPYAVC